MECIKGARMYTPWGDRPKMTLANCYGSAIKLVYFDIQDMCNFHIYNLRWVYDYMVDCQMVRLWNVDVITISETSCCFN